MQKVSAEQLIKDWHTIFSNNTDSENGTFDYEGIVEDLLEYMNNGYKLK